MNIQKRQKMNLEQALLTYGNDITYIVLRDGTNIEIIDDNDDFIEEKFEDNYNNYDNYMYKEIDPNGTLRGRPLKKSNVKPLRKTVLKSSINDQGKLKSTNKGNNIIFKHSENNEYLQCANCFKFFNSKENEEEAQDKNIQNNNINNNANIANININMNQNQQNIPRQVIPPQQGFNQNKQINQNNKINQNKQNYQKIPVQYPQNPPQIPRGPQQRMNMPPPPQQQYYNNQIPKGNMRMPDQRIPYYNQNNPIFRERKRNSGRYLQKESKSEFIQKNYVVNKYPGSAKKQKNPEINYINNNIGDYYQENEIRYYDYPPIKYKNNNYFVQPSNNNQEYNYYHTQVTEFQENDYYRY